MVGNHRGTAVSNHLDEADPKTNLDLARRADFPRGRIDFAVTSVGANVSAAL
jgi:hypothetical protein